MFARFAPESAPALMPASLTIGHPFLNLDLAKRSKRASAVACCGKALRQKQANLDQSRGQE
jgi:hypothetical protein